MSVQGPSWQYVIDDQVVMLARGDRHRYAIFARYRWTPPESPKRWYRVNSCGEPEQADHLAWVARHHAGVLEVRIVPGLPAGEIPELVPKPIAKHRDDALLLQTSADGLKAQGRMAQGRLL